MTRIVAISDTHGQHDKIDVPDGDILLHAGDFSAQGRLEYVEPFNDWLESLPHEHKIFVPGNHDFCFEADNKRTEAIRRMSSARVLIDEGLTVEGLKIWGSPWQPEFFDWAFNLPRGKPLREKWELIPQDVDVLVTHGPPYEIGDRLESREDPVGCEDLRDVVEDRRPAVHVFGHIHESYGIYRSDGIHYINASICDLDYESSNEPVILTVDEEKDASVVS